jgi:peptide/nickel transport system substrate-binding protein
MDFANYPSYREGEAQGNYDTILMNGKSRSQMGLTFNHWHPDPVMREVFGDVRFRNALSYAINRDEMNEVIYQGLGKPSTLPLPEDSSFVSEAMVEWAEEDVQYQPDRAEALLDEMGLEYDSAGEYRLAPDGSPLTVQFQLGHKGLAYTTRLELIQEYWEGVGVRTEFTTIEMGYYWELVNSQQADFAIWPNEWVEAAFQLNPSRPGPHATFGTNPWWSWFQSDGEQGVEPPAEAMRVYELSEQLRFLEPGTDEYVETGSEIVELHMDNRWMILDILDGPSPVILNKDLVTPVDRDDPFVWPYQKFWLAYEGETWFYDF